MPLGEIRPRVVTPQEAKWRLRWEAFEGRDIGGLYSDLRHMSRPEFMAFLYSVEPRRALLWTGLDWFRELMRYQRNKRWYHEVSDALWRGYHNVFGK